MLPGRRNDENLTSVLYDFHDLFECESTLGSETNLYKEPQRTHIRNSQKNEQIETRHSALTLFKYGRSSHAKP